MITAPNNGVKDLTFDGNSLWGGAFGKLYQFSIHNGNLLKEVDLPTYGIPMGGIAFDGNNFIINNGEGLGSIFVINTESCEEEIVNQFSFDAGRNKHGMHWHDDNLLLAVFYLNEQDTLFKIDTLGNKLDAYQLPTTTVQAIVHDGKNYWITSNANLNPLLFKLDNDTLEPIDTFIPPGGRYPLGLAWDGNYLWVSNTDSDEIYQLDVENPLVEFSARVFPNPFVQEVQFELSGSQLGYYVEILDLKGAIVEAVTSFDANFNITFDKNRLVSGLYFYLIYDLDKKELLAQGKLIAQ